MSMSKKDIVEALKALEVNFKPTQSLSELQKLLDKEMGVIEDNESEVINSTPDEGVELDAIVEANNKPVNKSDIDDDSITFASIAAYNKKLAMKRLGL